MNWSSWCARRTTVAVVCAVVLCGAAQSGYSEELPEPRALLGAARICMEKEDFDAAARLLRTLTSTYPDHELVTEARVLLGECLCELRRFDAAMEELQIVIDSHPESSHGATAHFHMASCYGRQDRDTEAIGEYEKFLSHPRASTDLVPEAHWWKAMALELLGDMSGAITEYQLITQRFAGTREAEASEEQLSFFRDHPEVVAVLSRANRLPWNFILWTGKLEFASLRNPVLYALFQGAQILLIRIAPLLLCLLIVLVVGMALRSARMALSPPLLEYRMGIYIYVYTAVASAALAVLSTVLTDSVLDGAGTSYRSAIDDLLSVGLIGAISLVMPVAYLARRGIPLSRIGLTKHQWHLGGIVKWGLFGVVFLVGALLVCAVLLSLWVGPPPPDEAARNYLFSQVTATESPLLIGSLLCLVVLVTPVGEEVLYRGVLYASLKRRVGRLGAALLSALLFSAIHVGASPVFLLSVLAGGLVLALLYERTKSLYPSIILHALVNGAVVLRLWLLPSP